MLAALQLHCNRADLISWVPQRACKRFSLFHTWVRARMGRHMASFATSMKPSATSCMLLDEPLLAPELVLISSVSSCSAVREPAATHVFPSSMLTESTGKHDREWSCPYNCTQNMVGSNAAWLVFRAEQKHSSEHRGSL